MRNSRVRLSISRCRFLSDEHIVSGREEEIFHKSVMPKGIYSNNNFYVKILSCLLIKLGDKQDSEKELKNGAGNVASSHKISKFDISVYRSLFVFLNFRT